ncbi:sortase-dependent protein, partial [Streptomyces griseoincarnatus]
MRRNVLSAAALACTAVLATAMPAFADDPSPVPDTTAAATDSGERSDGT